MKNKIFAFTFLLALTSFASTSDLRDTAILKSKMVTAILKGLRQEQGLQCQIAVEEDGNLSISYYVEDGFSKFSAGFACSGGDGKSAIITGILGDGGQTQTESFKMVFAD